MLGRFSCLVALAIAGVLSSQGRAAVVWNVTILNDSGVAQNNFSSGESGYVDISVDLTDPQLSTNASTYNSVIHLDNNVGITTSLPVDSNTTPNPGDDIHDGAPFFTTEVEGTGSEWVGGETDSSPTPPPSTTSLVRLPFTISGTDPATHTFNVVPNGSIFKSSTSWNGTTDDTADFDFSGATVFANGATAVPEPGSLALLVVGSVGGLIHARRRQRRQAACQPSV